MQEDILPISSEITGTGIQTLLKKAAGLDIQMICSLHGPVWRSNLNYFIEKHDKWSKYEPEQQAVAIIYGSIYGNTEQAADAPAAKLGAKGVKNIAVYDASKTDVSELIAEIFRVSHLEKLHARHTMEVSTHRSKICLHI